MARERAVQISATGQGSALSSGYLLSPTLVLACWHGIKHALDGGAIYVRGLDQLKLPANDPAFSGKILWANEAVDAALIELPGTHPISRRPLDGKMRFARLTSQVQCEGVGFPDAVAVAKSPTNNSYEFSGKTQRLTPDEILLLELGSDLRESGWPGVSGAAVLVGRAIVGIVRETHIRTGNGSLKAMPIDRVFAEPGFLDCIARHGLPTVVPHIARFDKQRIEPLVCHIDRHGPAAAFTDHFKSQPRWPAIVAVTGSARQKHRRFVERLATLEMKELAGIDTDAHKIFPDLQWPEDRDIVSTEAYRSWLAVSWEQLFQGETPVPSDFDAEKACVDQLKEALANEAAPFGFWVKINYNTVRQGSGHGSFLKKWAALWSAVSSNRPFIIFLCLVEDEPAAEDKRVRRYPWDKLAELEAGPTWDDVFIQLFTDRQIHGDSNLNLKDMGHREIAKWVEHLYDRLGRHSSAPAVYSHEIEDLTTSLTLKLADSFSMTDFDTHVDNFFLARPT